MQLGKWNYETHKYEPHFVPDEWNVKLFSDDMNEIINCPHCGKEFTFGESYCSLEIHNYIGLGFATCETCYEKEWERRNNDRRTKEEA